MIFDPNMILLCGSLLASVLLLGLFLIKQARILVDQKIENHFHITNPSQPQFVSQGVPQYSQMSEQSEKEPFDTGSMMYEVHSQTRFGKSAIDMDMPMNSSEIEVDNSVDDVVKAMIALK